MLAFIRLSQGLGEQSLGYKRARGPSYDSLKVTVIPGAIAQHSRAQWVRCVNKMLIEIVNERGKELKCMECGILLDKGIMKEVTVKISKAACLCLLRTGTKGGHYHPWPRFPNLNELKEVLLW